MIITALCTARTSAWQQPLNKWVYSVIYASIKLLIVYFPLWFLIHCLHCCGDGAHDSTGITVKPVLVSGFVLRVFSLEPKYYPEHIREALRILNSINLCIWCRPVMFLGLRFPFSPPNQLFVAAVPYYRSHVILFNMRQHDLSNEICQRTKTYTFHQLNQCKYVVLHAYTGTHTQAHIHRHTYTHTAS